MIITLIHPAVSVRVTICVGYPVSGGVYCRGVCGVGSVDVGVGADAGGEQDENDEEGEEGVGENGGGGGEGRQIKPHCSMFDSSVCGTCGGRRFGVVVIVGGKNSRLTFSSFDRWKQPYMYTYLSKYAYIYAVRCHCAGLLQATSHDSILVSF